MDRGLAIGRRFGKGIRNAFESALAFTLISCVLGTGANGWAASSDVGIFREKVLLSLLKQGEYGAFERYLLPHHYFGESEDIVSVGVTCTSDQCIRRIVVQAFATAGYRRDYDINGLRNCTTFVQRASHDEFTILVNTVRVCVHSSPVFARCNVTFLIMGSQMRERGSSLQESFTTRDRFMDDTVSVVRNAATTLETLE